jgi:hypothetical protein
MRQQRACGAVLLRDERRKQVHRFDVLVITPDRQALRVGKRFLEFGGEFVDSHFLKAPILNTTKMRRFLSLSSTLWLKKCTFLLFDNDGVDRLQAQD